MKSAMNNTHVVYPKTTLRNVIEIKQIVSLFYFEYAKDFVFSGESHNFWEFLYVDRGQVEVMADTTGYRLEQGDIIFHKPDEFHSVWANGITAPNLYIASFLCDSPAMAFFENKILKAGEEEKTILSHIIKERKRCFRGKLNEWISEKDLLPDAEANTEFGSQQLLKMYLEMLMISFIRNNTPVKKNDRESSLARDRVEQDILKRVITYMKENTDKNLSIDDFCNAFLLSRTKLKSLFREKMDMGVIQYFRIVKIDKAKELMREGRYNFSEISDMLAFSSIGYFSSVFKKITGMTPSEYVTSVKFGGDCNSLYE